MVKRRRGKIKHSYTVTYNSQSHWSVITQMWGSDWPRLLPFCIFNTAIMATLHILLWCGIDLQISGQAHNFMSLVVAFLLVSRVTTSLERYWGAREYLETMNKNCLQLIHSAAFYSNADSSDSAKEWRNEVTYQTLILLRAAMAVVNYPSTGIALWEIPQLGGRDVLDDVQKNLPPLPWLCQEERSDFEWNLRIPVRLSYLLGKSIRSQQKRLRPPIPVVAEGDLYAFVNGFMDGYYGLDKYMTTPVPFQLIQMTTTFLFFYLFTVPFALLSDDTSVFTAVAHCCVVFILTYGVMGMELVSIQLDDPFGDDVNDFNNIALAQTAFEEAYITILDIDGPAWASKLLLAIEENSEEPAPTEQSFLLHRQL